MTNGVTSNLGANGFRERMAKLATEAVFLVTGDRDDDYGHPLQDHTRTALMWSAIIGTEVTAEQVCLCMAALKISRECHKPKRDNLVDGIGYLMNAYECSERAE